MSLGNTFLEGLIAIILGGVMVTLAKFYTVPELETGGVALMGIGLGHMNGGAASKT